MEPFVYEDYSDFDTAELDFEPSPRAKYTPSRRLRSISPFEVDVDEEAMEKIRNRARQATSDFLDSCDAIRKEAKEKDSHALRKFDAAIELPMSAATTKIRWGSVGLPPRAPRTARAGSFVSDHSNFAAMPPMPPRQSLISRNRYRSPQRPPSSSVLPPSTPPSGSTTSTVMNEISALEAFARDTRPLHEKLPPGPPVHSRFVRSVTPGSRFLSSPRVSVSPVRSGSLAPRTTFAEQSSYHRSGSATPQTSVEVRPLASRLSGTTTEPEIRERISTRRKMRDVESRLDKILDYELPYTSGFKEMRNSLREINDKMTKHRLLIDRYSGLQMDEDNGPVADRVNAKVDELIPRVPALSGVQNPFKPRSADVTSSFDPRLIPGYSTGLCVTPNEGTSELRGRIRNLLCRTRESSRRDAANPHLKPLSTTNRRTATAAE